MTEEINWTEVFADRRKWIAQLLNPKSEKTTRKLEDYNNPNARCCLGHACHALGIPVSREGNEVTYLGRGGVLPPRALERLQLYSNNGNLANQPGKLYNVFHVSMSGKIIIREDQRVQLCTLADLNDHTSVTPQQIGRMLEANFHNPVLWKLPEVV